MTKSLSLLTVAGVAVAWLALCGQAQSSLINHWKFDETGGAATAVDSAGSLNAALQGDADFVNDALRGQVLELDGNGDYANNSGQPFTSDTNHTVAGWVNHFDSGNLSQRWISWGGSGGRYFVGPYSGNGGRIFAGFGNKSVFFTHADSKPVEDTWQHWAFVREGTSASLYLDGELLETLTVAAGGSTGTGELRIGRQYGGNSEYLHGQIDDLAVWNEALTGQQINYAMNLGAEYYGVPEPSSAALLLTAALGASWRFGSDDRMHSATTLERG